MSVSYRAREKRTSRSCSWQIRSTSSQDKLAGIMPRPFFVPSSSMILTSSNKPISPSALRRASRLASDPSLSSILPSADKIWSILSISLFFSDGRLRLMIPTFWASGESVTMAGSVIPMVRRLVALQPNSKAANKDPKNNL